MKRRLPSLIGLAFICSLFFIEFGPIDIINVEKKRVGVPPTQNYTQELDVTIQDPNFCKQEISDQEQEDTANKKTLLYFLAYKRGGSTFVGDIFNNHPDVFYVFEPVWFPQVHLFSAGYGKYRHSGSMIAEGQKLLKKLPTCNYTDGYLANFTAYQESRHSVYRSRAMAKEKGCDDEDLEARVSKCTRVSKNTNFSSPDQWKKTCQSYNVHVYKILRLHVLDVASLLDQPDYNVKILHMIRDPRGILRSRMNLGWRNVRNETKFPSRLCYDMMDNYDSAVRLNLPDDVLKIVRYEDIASDPINKTKELFSFVGLNYTAETEHYLKRNALGDTEATVTERRREAIMGTFRRNSTETAERWRHGLSKSQILTIEKQCGEFLERVGYDFVHLSNKKYIPLLKSFDIIPGIM